VVTSSVIPIKTTKEAAMSAMYEELARMRLRETLQARPTADVGLSVRRRREFRFQWWRRHSAVRVEQPDAATPVVVAMATAPADRRDAA
jgi:hypothetical protein